VLYLIVLYNQSSFYTSIEEKEMRKAVFALIILPLLLAAVPCCFAEDTHELVLDFTFADSGLFSRYDVELSLDGESIRKLPYGESCTITRSVGDGTHTVTLQKSDDASISHSSELSVSRDTVWLCTIHTGAKSIELCEKRIEALNEEKRLPEDTAAPDKDPQVQTYILNTHTHKFHTPDCKNAAAIKEKNKAIREDSRENIISEGYSPCGSCKP
jgi:hypothetical protein